MSNSKGAAFYASGNIASEALRQYCTDLWTEAYAAKAVRDDDVILLSWVSTLSTYCINNEVRTGTMSNAMPLMPAAAVHAGALMTRPWRPPGLLARGLARPQAQ